MRERVCKNCGGRQYKIVGQNMLKCSFCGTIYVDELASKEEEVLLVGANEALRETRFDEALSQFEKIINLFPRSFEGYFGKALSKNKIVLYNNSKGTKKTPRFFKSPQPLTNDEDFKKALELAPAEVQKDYLDIANKVDKIINNLSQEQYDIVVCEEDNENLENIFQSLKTNYKVYFTKKEREENSFSAISSCKLFIYITKEGKNFYRGEIKNFFDRFMYFVSLKEKLKSGFFIICEDIKKLPKELTPFKNIFSSSSSTLQQDLAIQIKLQMERAVKESVKIEKRSVKQVDPIKNIPTDIVSVTPRELGHYNLENLQPSESNKIKWIELLLKNGDFASAKELIDKMLVEDPNNAELLFAKLMCDKKIKTQTEFFSTLQNFDNKQVIDKILTFSSKEFAENFVDNWEHLIERLDNEQYYNMYLLYLAKYNTPNLEKFVNKAMLKAVETLDDELIEKVLKCFAITDVEKFVNFYFLLAQKSGDEKYYQKVLALDQGHEQSQIALFLHNFTSVEDKLTYRNKSEIEKVFGYLSENTRDNFIGSIINLILPVSFVDLSMAEQQLDFYLSYISNDEVMTNILQNMAQKFQEMDFFKQAEKYIVIAISKDTKNSELYWQLIKIKAHCKTDSELILSPIKIASLPECETLLSISNEQQAEKYAEIISKSNMFKGQKKKISPERLDKKLLHQKLQEFVLRNQQILLEAEKLALDGGVYYYKLQLQPFERYIKDLQHIQTFEDYLNFYEKLTIRLQALSLNLDASISLTMLQEKQKAVIGFQPQPKLEDNVKTIDSLKNDKFFKAFIYVFFKIVPLFFASSLIISLMINKATVYAHFNKIFILCLIFYNLLIAIINTIWSLVSKNKIKQNIYKVIIYIWGYLNVFLCLIAFGFDVEEMFNLQSKLF